MAEFRKWSLRFEDGNNLADGKRVLDPPGYAATAGKELVRATGQPSSLSKFSQSICGNCVTDCRR